MSKYQVTTLTFKELDSRVMVPSFQRRLVWSKSQKASFIETLKNGYPFGSILIYRYSNDTLTNDKFSLIDGLQRFTTIRDYSQNPASYMKFDGLIDELYGNLSINQASSSTKEIKKLLELILFEFTKTVIKNDIPDKVHYLYMELTDKKYGIKNLSSILATDSMEVYGKEISPILQPIVNGIEGELSHSKQISDLVIPTVIFTGDETELADVFHNLNRGGKKLSKYQVFAAQWSNKELNLPRGRYSDEILSINIERYSELDSSRDVEIQGFDVKIMNANRVLNFAEICFAIGNLIIRELSVFMTLSSDILKSEDLANELGYSTVGVTFGISNRKLHNLIEYYNVFNDKKEFMEDYISNILQVYKDINNEFRAYLKIPGKDDRYVRGGHTNFMILSYFSTLWHLKYEVDLKNSQITVKSGYRNDYQKAKNNFIFYYLHDQAVSFWSGTGDAKLDSITVDKNQRYLKPINLDKLESDLLSWNDERTAHSNLNFDNLSKTICTLIVNLDDKVNFLEDEYDFEHVLPRKILSPVYKEHEIAGGSLGNIMILNSSKNRSKKAISLYDSNFEHQHYSDEFLKTSNYPTKLEIDNYMHILQYEKDKSEVVKFIVRRGKDTIVQLIRLLNRISNK